MYQPLCPHGVYIAREKVALLIGNWLYDADSLPNLSTPENDVRTLMATLTECGFKVSLCSFSQYKISLQLYEDMAFYL